MTGFNTKLYIRVEQVDVLNDEGFRWKKGNKTNIKSVNFQKVSVKLVSDSPNTPNLPLCVCPIDLNVTYSEAKNDEPTRAHVTYAVSVRQELCIQLSSWQVPFIS